MGAGEEERCGLSVGAEDQSLHWGGIQVEHRGVTLWRLTYSGGTSWSPCVLRHIVELAQVSQRAALS